MNKSEAPKTVREIGVHIAYISDSIREIKETMKDTPTRGEFGNLEERVTLLETDGKGDDNKFVTRREVYAIVGVIGLIGTILGIILALVSVAKGLIT